MLIINKVTNNVFSQSPVGNLVYVLCNHVCVWGYVWEEKCAHLDGYMYVYIHIYSMLRGTSMYMYLCRESKRTLGINC